MRQRSRVLTYLAVVIGLVLALAWQRSYWVSDGLFWKDKRVMLRVVSSRGRVLVGYWRSTGAVDLPQVVLGYSRRLPRDVVEMPLRPEAGGGGSRWGLFDFMVQRDQGVGVTGGVVVMPYWMLLLAGAMLVSGKRLVWTPLVRRRRRRRGLCMACGYDLRGSAERCPECGFEINRQDKKKGRGDPAPTSSITD